MKNNTKLLLIVFNIFFIVGGLALIVLGCSIRLWSINVIHGLNLTPMLLILIGCIVLLVAFFGFYGIAKENAVVLMTFSVLLTMTFLCQITVEIAVSVWYNEQTLKENLTKSMFHYNLADHQQHTDTWDSDQTKYQCCGINSYRDWFNTSFAEGSDVPDSCCLHVHHKCGQEMLLKSVVDHLIHTQGCLPAMTESIADFATGCLAISITSGIVQLVCIAASYCLAFQHRHKLRGIHF